MTVLDGTGLIALSRHRVIGVVVRGDSLLRAFDGNGGEGLVLSSAEPTGHVTLTGIGTAGMPGRQAAAVPPGHVADMINRARADVPSRIG